MSHRKEKNYRVGCGLTAASALLVIATITFAILAG